MNINTINSGYAAYQSSKAPEKVSAKEDTKATSESKSKDTDTVKKNTKSDNSAYSKVSATYEKSTDNNSYKASLSGIATAKDRTAIVAQLKADSDQRLASMQSLVTQMFQKQGITIGNADDMWKVLASGKFTADPATIKQAQKDISEDGYWGVKQTSDRIFSFALALSGGDEAKMKTMVSAVQKGFKEATKTWGKKLPSITDDTYSAVMDKFDNWFKDNGSAKSTSDSTTASANTDPMTAEGSMN